MSVTIDDSGVVTMDPADKRVIQFDWDDENLGTSVEISTSAWAITAIVQSGATLLTKDNESIVTGNRKTKVRLLATTATAGDYYEVENTIVTNESPAQTKNKQFYVLIQD